MPSYQPPVEDASFVLFDLLQADRLWAGMPAFEEVTRDLAEAVLGEAGRLACGEFLPLAQSGDAQGCRWDDGVVTTPEGFPAAWQAYADGGWVGVGGDAEYGGQGLPKMLTVAVDEMFCSANTNLSLYSILTAGAALALSTHASEDIRQRFLPGMYSGRWTGTMDLTEGHAGTDLGMLRTRAEPLGDGRYRLNGGKIFITSGEHDMAENIIHLVLARLVDAPAGTRGLSLFVVPKFLVDADGNMGERNPVFSGGIEEKMGIHGSATNIIRYEDAIGEMVGEPGQGLACMFTMMNYERLSVGLQGVAIGEVAAQNAALYARDRRQGRSASGPEEPGEEADSLLVHADVRRMLLTQRAFNEGGRAFAAVVGAALDGSRYSADEDERNRLATRAALLTPVAKAFLSDRGFDTTVSAQQVFGGHGYIREWGMEQFVRDSRIAQIYEGTNGIQSQDLLGRKVARDGGQGMQAFVAEMRADAKQAEDRFTAPLLEAIDVLEAATRDALAGAAGDPHAIGAVAVDYLDLTGYVSLAWLWARMARLGAERDDPFGARKVATGEFYFDRILPRIHGLARSISAGGDACMALAADAF